MKDIIIAIDGHSSCGKSTLARDLAKELNYLYITSGAMYRAVTWYIIDQAIIPDDHTAISDMLEEIDIKFGDKGRQVMLNGNDISEELTTMPVANLVSQISAIPKVRRKLVQMQQKIGKDKKIVMDGRDIGTVVFPKAELKIFMTADLEVRTQRRYQELRARGLQLTVEEVRQNLKKRDRIDSTRQDSPLRQADDAVLLDTSNLTPNEQLQMTLALAKSRMGVLRP